MLHVLLFLLYTLINDYKKKVNIGESIMAKVTKDMGILEVAQSYPESIPVFQKYGMGCLGCAAARFENLEAGAKVHGFDVEAFVSDINAAIGE